MDVGDPRATSSPAASSGASSVLSLAAKLFGNEKLSRTALYLGAVADAVSPPLLDLRPRPAGALPPHAARLQGDLADERRRVDPARERRRVEHGGGARAARTLKPVKLLAELVAALFGPPLATYTGVLLADTAVPVWHEARQELPWLFGASAAASAGAAACLFLDPDDAGPARRLAVGGVVAEGALMQTMELRLGETGEVYHQGEAGKLAWAAKGLAGAGAALLATRGERSRGARPSAARSCARGSCACAGRSSRPASSRRATRSTP